MLVCELLTEARKNPELNKKITTLNQLKAIAKKYPKQQLYATFTTVHKLGTNPRYGHHTTPFGIYVYPLKYVISKKLDVPYMSEAPYVQVVSIAEQSIPKIWYLGDEQSSLIAKQRLQEMFPGITWTGGDTGKDVWASFSEYAMDYCPTGIRTSVFMRQMLVKCGFDGVIDNKGKGIIHPNEPTQGVFFSKQAIKLLQVLDNRPRLSNVSLRADDLATSGNMTAQHAFNIVKGKGRRIKNLEPYILQDVELAIKYVQMFPKQFVNGRWPEGERIVLSTMKPNDVATYATAVIKGRWPEAEPIILNSDYVAFYASANIKGRWPEAEEAICSTLKSPHRYAEVVIKGRWPEAEEAIIKAQNADAATKYAINILGNRWPEAESFIKKDPEARRLYRAWVWHDL